MENHGFDQVAGHSPFLNALAHRCGLAAGYHARSRIRRCPTTSALTSGSTQGLVGQDCSPGDACQSDGQSIFSQTPWRAYAESMTGRCALTNSGDYAVRHNPAVYYTRVKGECATADVPLTELPRDLRGGGLAPYTFIAPNLCSDEHNCGVANGDAWLARWIPRLTSSAVYRRGATAIFITYDEDDYGEDNRVYTVVVARSVRPGPCPRRRSPTTRCCARTSSSWACRRSARRRRPHRWRRPSTSPADVSERPEVRE